MNRKVLFLAPLLVFVILAGFLGKGLFSDPRILESGKVGKPLPSFQLPDLMDANKIWQSHELIGKPFMLNVWGVWCPTCNAELAYLTELREQGVPIIGLYFEQWDPDFDGDFNLRALQQEVQAKLNEQGNPYQFNLFDLKRSTALDLGVSGAPETFMVDSQGIIRLHHVGDINPQIWRSKLAPIWQTLQEEQAP